MSILWTIIIGFVAGVIAKLLHPGPNEPAGFILTTVLGIVGALVATYLGQAIGWYHAGEGAGLVGAVVGALIVLVIWGFLAPRDTRAIAGPRLYPLTCRRCSVAPRRGRPRAPPPASAQDPFPHSMPR